MSRRSAPTATCYLLLPLRCDPGRRGTGPLTPRRARWAIVGGCALHTAVALALAWFGLTQIAVFDLLLTVWMLVRLLLGGLDVRTETPPTEHQLWQVSDD